MTVKNFSLVWETSTTTGTGNFTLTGARANYRALDDVIATGETFPYVIRMDAAYEVGLGYKVSADVFARSVVFESSNAGAAVNWAAGTKQVYLATSGLNQAPLKHRFGTSDSIVPVNGTDNADLGYSQGSIWFCSGRAFLCLSAVRNAATGAMPDADWKEITPFVSRIQDNAGLDVSDAHHILTDIIVETAFKYECSALFAAGYGADHLVNGKAYASVILGDGVEANTPTTAYHGYGYFTAVGQAQRAVIGLIKETVNATPVQIYPWADNTCPLKVRADSCLLIKHRVCARNDVDDVVSTWEWNTTIKRQGTGDPTIVGTNTPVVIGQDGGAAAWAVALTIDTTLDALVATVTGEATKTIRWFWTMDVQQVAF